MPTIDERADDVRRAWSPDLDAAVTRAHARGYDASAVSPANLAWTIAWLATHPDDAGSAFRELRRVAAERGTPDDLAPLRARMTRPLAGQGPATTPLEELATSIACEHRVDWHEPTTPGDASPAAVMFERLCAEHRASVERICRSVSTIAAEDLAAEVWSGLYQAYWSPASTKRWSGLARVTTLAHTSARWLAAKSGRDVPVEPGPGADRIAASLGLGAAERAEICEAYRACRDDLPARQRLFVELRLQQELRPADIARVVGCGKPNVAQVLAQALRGLQACLAGKGFGGAALQEDLA